MLEALPIAHRANRTTKPAITARYRRPRSSRKVTCRDQRDKIFIGRRSPAHFAPKTQRGCRGIKSVVDRPQCAPTPKHPPSRNNFSRPTDSFPRSPVLCFRLSWPPPIDDVPRKFLLSLRDLLDGVIDAIRVTLSWRLFDRVYRSQLLIHIGQGESRLCFCA